MSWSLVFVASRFYVRTYRFLRRPCDVQKKAPPALTIFNPAPLVDRIDMSVAPSCGVKLHDCIGFSGWIVVWAAAENGERHGGVFLYFVAFFAGGMAHRDSKLFRTFLRVFRGT